jgi:hypothetical protein
VGTEEGAPVGVELGKKVGETVGMEDGMAVVGASVGCALIVGTVLGTAVGTCVGFALCCTQQLSSQQARGHAVRKTAPREECWQSLSGLLWVQLLTWFAVAIATISSEASVQPAGTGAGVFAGTITVIVFCATVGATAATENNSGTAKFAATNDCVN